VKCFFAYSNPSRTEINDLEFFLCWAIINRDIISFINFSPFSVISIYADSSFEKEIMKILNFRFVLPSQVYDSHFDFFEILFL
jgi:hypothetical protein